MRKIKPAIIMAALAGVVGARATITLKFDNVPTPNTWINTTLHYGPMPANYGGLSWSANWEVENSADYLASYGNTAAQLPPSTPNFAYNSDGVLAVATSSGQLFDFVGASVSTWANNGNAYRYSSSTITVNGYKGNTLVASTGPIPLSPSFQWLSANFQGVDKVEFKNDGVSSHWWGMDDFTYTPVPELSTYLAGALFLLPFGIHTLRRMRKS